jgi:hypothetical protein
MKRLIIAAALCSVSASANAWTIYDSPHRRCNPVPFNPDEFAKYLGLFYQRAPVVDDTWNTKTKSIIDTKLTIDMGDDSSLTWRLFRDPKACADYAKMQPQNPKN